MMRLSRPLRLPRWTLAIAAIIWLAMLAASIYFFNLNRHITRELVHHTWREPT